MRASRGGNGDWGNMGTKTGLSVRAKSRRAAHDLAIAKSITQQWRSIGIGLIVL